MYGLGNPFPKNLQTILGEPLTKSQLINLVTQTVEISIYNNYLIEETASMAKYEQKETPYKEIEI